MTETPTAEQAQDAASTAADEGMRVTEVAQEEARKVAGEATEQVRAVVDDARTQMTEQVGEQTRQQRDNLVSTLGTFGDDLEQMAENTDSNGLAVSVASEVAHHTQSITSYLDGREPGELLQDVRDFARRRPGAFLLGALVAGVVAGRLTRGVKDADPGTASGSASSGSTSSPARPTSSLTDPVDAGMSDSSGSIPPPPSYPPQTAGLGTDTAGYGRGQEFPGGTA